jgi:26S proteasome regulatory subunit N7
MEHFSNRTVEMGPYYRSITSISDPSSSSSSSTVALEKDDALLKELEAKNAEELKKLDEKLAEAEKNEGETEISEALKARAFYFTKIGDKVRPSVFLPFLCSIALG